MANRVRVTSVDPWSVAKISFVLSVAMGIVVTVALAILWLVLSVAGIWDALNSAVSVVLSTDANAFDITDYIGFGRLIGFSLVVSAMNVVLFTALATIAAYLYNAAAKLLQGVEIGINDDL